MTIPIEFIMCIVLVESAFNPSAIGDGGKALGILQMHKEYVEDAAEHAGEDWTHSDALIPEKAIKIFYAYMDRYCTKKELGRKPTLQDVARIHNGGPNGYKKESTKMYWHLVKIRYDKVK
jgi:soluble lytic murein transglycosylase-like protein